MERQIQFEKIKEIVNETLSCKDEVIAGYLYGSFLHGNYCDIDIGLLLDEHFRPSALYEVGIASELEKRTGMKNFDIRVLNNRPVRFLFSTLKNSVHCDSFPAERAFYLRSDFCSAPSKIPCSFIARMKERG